VLLAVGCGALRCASAARCCCVRPALELGLAAWRCTAAVALPAALLAAGVLGLRCALALLAVGHAALRLAGLAPRL
jgi:hypothetical protein